ncbi:MAG: glycosyltransferase family 2 protein [Pseudomonadota bacterium]
MILAMTLLVRDEEDIVGENIAYHLDQGVDHVIVTDHLSVDGTPDIVNEYVKQGVATYIAEKSRSFDQSGWVTRMARMASVSFGARWVLNNDADEFWLAPAGRDLKSFFARQLFHNIVEARRFDFICLKEDDGRPFWRRMVYAKKQSVNALGRDLPSKVAHRGSPKITVADGNHAAWGGGRLRVKRNGLEIAHYPIRSRAQYIDKIRRGGEALAGSERPAHVYDAWRSQFEELQATGSIAWLEDNIVDGPTLQKMLSNGEAVIDRRVETRFSRSLAGHRSRPAFAAL